MLNPASPGRLIWLLFKQASKACTCECKFEFDLQIWPNISGPQSSIMPRSAFEMHLNKMLLKADYLVIEYIVFILLLFNALLHSVDLLLLI